MPGWNIAGVFGVVAAAVPASPAPIQGDRVLSWREMDRRAGQVAAYLAAQGLGRQDARAVGFAGSFTATIERTRASVPGAAGVRAVADR